jgi:hypothetical protein
MEEHFSPVFILFFAFTSVFVFCVLAMLQSHSLVSDIGGFLLQIWQANVSDFML